ncbi:ligand-binding sensor domain-containing protein [Belliella pelovolcani]|uniref:Two component regulator propeller n=1 Tax=Belliella pelovolcani TaxID=529505 RepID=A0A1N7NW36_9BACT|nr:sensor histidine kinase [Belliella pelovolcani]SIT02501.1 Two component regulator propeller [Belliella pelovolcani]
MLFINSIGENEAIDKYFSLLMKCFYTILLLIVTGVGCFASPNRFFNKLTIADGLSSNNVYSVWQDKKGYIWIGTSNGLQRFDGKSFLYFPVLKPAQRYAQPVRQILEDLDGNMWIRYGDSYGIFNPSDYSFKEVPLEKADVRFHGEKLWIDSKGQVFLILRRNKILYYDQQKSVFSEVGNPIRYPKGHQPICITEDRKTGYYWIGSQQGISVYDPISNQIFEKGQNPKNLPHLDNEEIKVVFDISIDQSRNFWIVFWNPDQRFLTINEKTGDFVNLASQLVNTSKEYREMKTSLESRSGELWYYGVNSLYILEPNQLSFSTPRNEFFRFSEIYQVFEDREGGIWLASDEGLYYYIDDFPEINYQSFHELEPDHLLLGGIELEKSGKKELWIPSWGRGILVLDQNYKDITPKYLYQNAPQGRSTTQPWCLIQENSSGKIWIGNQEGWLHIVDPTTQSSKFYNFPVFKNSTIRSISEDSSGNIWFTTQRGDLIKYKAGLPVSNDAFQVIRSFNGFTLAHLVDQQNRVWVCTSNNGVYCLDSTTGETIRHLDDTILSSNKVEKITQLNDSIFFFGYDLLNAYNFNSHTNRILSYSEGMISNDILHMLIDNGGYLWLNTPNGICKYNYFRNQFIHYGSKDGFGLMERDGNGGFLRSDGKIIFTGYYSFVEFDPMDFNQALTPEMPLLTSLKLFDNFIFVDSLTTEKKRTFNHHQNAFTFFFSTLNFINQDKLTYHYRLSGIDEEWRTSGNANMAIYSLLPPGKYILEFRSENEEGRASAVGSFSFRITPPYYETWWFRLLVILSIIGTLLLIYRLHLNRILAVVKVRNRVARDLHDDMGSTLSTINILSAMAKTKLGNDPVKTSEYISKISDNSQRMLEAMDDIVWSIKPQNDSMEKVISRMREFAFNGMDAKEIDVRFEIEESVYQIKLPMDYRRDLFLIFKEAVNNLIKYSDCRRAFIHFYVQKNVLIMKIRDYGKGFDLQNDDSGNGLNNMQKRAETMGGKLQIKSKIGEGTEVVLEIRV